MVTTAHSWIRLVYQQPAFIVRNSNNKCKGSRKVGTHQDQTCRAERTEATLNGKFTGISVYMLVTVYKCLKSINENRRHEVVSRVCSKACCLLLPHNQLQYIQVPVWCGPVIHWPPDWLWRPCYILNKHQWRLTDLNAPNNHQRNNVDKTRTIVHIHNQEVWWA